MRNIELVKFDPAKYLEGQDDIAEYLADMLDDNDEALTRHALNTARRARLRLGLPAVAAEVDLAQATRKG